MESNQMNSRKKKRFKVKNFSSQKQQVYRSLMESPKTTLMISIETGILRANVCRHVNSLGKENRITMVYKSICVISKYRAGFYSANPELFPSIVEPSNTVELWK